MEGRQITNLRIGVRVPARLQKWRIGNREGCHYFAPVGKLAKPPHFLCGHCGFESRREYILYYDKPCSITLDRAFFHYTPFSTSTGLLLAAFSVCDPIIKNAINNTTSKPTNNSVI